MLRTSGVRLLLLVVAFLLTTFPAPAQIAITVGFAPPELPVYEQPACPGDNYIWTPGYWAWDPDDDDYYWVPGTWVLAPQVGYFWTPPYWGWGSGAYVFYPGYWGPQIGFYGGINYGFGYFGHGYDGGRWENGRFFYNRYVNNVNVTVVHNVYETRVENRYENQARVSYNGGNGGVNARPTSQEESFGRERHIGPTSAQTQHYQAAQRDRQFRASDNHGRPPVAATAKPGEFSGHDVVAARSGGNYTPPANRGNGHGSPPSEHNRPPSTENNRAATPENNRAATPENNRPPTAGHVRDLPPMQRGNPPNTGNAKLDQKYQQQQEKLYNKQNQQRQQLQQRQEQEHQKVAQQHANDARQQQLEQRHQQQTQQMVQKHTQQQQQMQQRQAPPSHNNEKPQSHH